ncbi:MAG: molybdenum cofactor guanylyltransferase [Endomicrobiia bacterium]
MTGIILSGGKNTRIGTNKAFLKIIGMEIIEIIVDKFKDIFEEIIVVTNSTEEYQHLEVKLVKDIIPNKDSLGGLYSGLVNSKNQYNFVVACDMPFVNVELIKFMKSNYNSFDVVVPKLKNGYEPLHAIYSKNCIGPVKKQIERNNLKIIDFFSEVRVKEITEDTIRQFDPQLLSFFNINTEDDYQQALNIAMSLRT